MSTYVISDIHGWWDKFEDFLTLVNSDDIVYVLGDVIDRGRDGIKILQYIMKHQNQFKMILGNHEYMMLDFLNALDNEYNSPGNYLNVRYNYVLWVLNNQGDVTLTAYEALSEEEKKEIKEFLTTLPVAYQNVEVNGNIFYLVHSMPGSNAFNYMTKKDVLEQKDLREKEIFEYVWERPEDPENYYLDNHIIVAGHTIAIKWHGELEVFCSGDEAGNMKYIDIDCGCAIGSEASKLACLCLDDMSIYYF